MRARLPIGLLVFAQLCSSVARADSPEACFDAAVAGQEQRDAGKLVAARARFIACAKSTCPDEVQKDCTRWLGEVEASLPTIVFGARDADGHDLLDVRVTVDGTPSGDTAQGKPIALDPGTHRVKFEREGAASVEQMLVVRAGEKNRSVVVVFEGFEGGARASRIPTATWVLAGVGVVGLGVFAYFGGRGLSDYRHFGCEQGCTASDKSKVDTQFRIADIGLVIGVGALAAATVVWLVQPSEGKPAVAVAFTPTAQGPFGAIDVRF
jgi:hypothetical protein